MGNNDDGNNIPINTACIGFIGLGMMGFPTVKNLLDKGYTVVVFDLNPDVVEKLASLGAKPASSLKEVAFKATFIFTMITGPKAVQAVYLGSDGLIANLKHPKTYLIESSTIGYSTVKQVRKVAEEAGHIFMDCPISGGSPGANAGTLTFMVGGTWNEYSQVKDFLGIVGKKVIYAGPSSSAQMIKICNNLCFAINMMGAIESYKMVCSLGADPQAFTDIANHSTGGSFVTQVYSPFPNVTPSSPSNDDYNGGYSLDLALKDMHIAQEIAKEQGINMPLLDKAVELYEKVQKKGFGHFDFSIAFKLLE